MFGNAVKVGILVKFKCKWLGVQCVCW